MAEASPLQVLKMAFKRDTDWDKVTSNTSSVT